MPVMLERWNDERMDDLAGKVDGIGVQLREQRRELREEMRAQRTELRQEILELRRGIRAGAIGLSGSVIVGFATLVATQL